MIRAERVVVADPVELNVGEMLALWKVEPPRYRRRSKRANHLKRKRLAQLTVLLVT